MNNNLRVRRLAAHAIQKIIKEKRFGNMAEHFNSELFEEWDVRSDWEVFAIKNERTVFEAYIAKDNTVTVVIPCWYDLIRADHLSSFDHRLYDITIDDG